jgi:hypothetical protein
MLGMQERTQMGPLMTSRTLTSIGEYSMKKIVGKRGSWYATFDGESLPCTHEHWVDKKLMEYEDPGAKPGTKKWDDFIDSLGSKGKAILTDDKFLGDGMGFKRKSYIGVFEIANVRMEDDMLKFKFVRRIQ